MNSIVRWLIVVFGIGVLLLVAVGLVWYLAYDVSDRYPDRQLIAGLGAPATIAWDSEGSVTIHASGPDDALTALGFVHGWNRGWSIVLWRQAALGRLGEWLGPSAVDIDALTRRLGFAALARTTFQRLDPADRGRLRAYTDGVNAALLSRNGRLRPELVLLDVDVEPWEPWHTLAIERLFSWLATPSLSTVQPAAGNPAIADLIRSDRRLRLSLQLFGFQNGVAWAMQDSLGTLLFQRYVHGATALPFLQEINLRMENHEFLMGASLPGTPYFWAAQTDRQAWVVLPSGSAVIEHIPLDPSTVRTAHDRILLRNGSEHLISFRRTETSLALEPNASGIGVDTVWALTWTGLLPGTDLAGWFALQSGRAPSFSLLRGDGLIIDPNGSWTVLGAPSIRQAFPGGIFVGNTPWSAYAAELLQAQDTQPVPVRTWIDDAYSIWAAHYAPSLTTLMEPTATSSPAFRDALTYLRNWDFAYDRTSIAASIFDTWMTRYRKDVQGVPFVFDAPDSLRASAPQLQRSLEAAVNTLEESYGPDLRQWRWERVQPDSLFFPAWSLVSGTAASASQRYAPLVFPGHGHPTSLAWGPSPIEGALSAPAVWEAWVRTDTWGRYFVRRRTVSPHAPLGRYLASDRPPLPFLFPHDHPPAHVTSLTSISAPR